MFEDYFFCVCMHFLLRFARPYLLMCHLCSSTCGYVTYVQSSWTGTLNSLSVWNAASFTKEKNVHIIMCRNTTRYYFWLLLLGMWQSLNSDLTVFKLWTFSADLKLSNLFTCQWSEANLTSAQSVHVYKLWPEPIVYTVTWTTNACCLKIEFH